MIRPDPDRRGIALITIIMMLLIFSILGVSVAGLTTGQYRFALKRTNDIASRQAALAAVEKANHLLAVNTDWLNASSFMLINDHHFPDSDRYCSVDLIPASCSDSTCSLIAWGYAKSPSGQRILKKGVQVTFKRDALTYAVTSLASLSSLSLNGCSVKGKIAAFQMTDSVSFNALTSLNPSGSVILTVPPASHVLIDEIPSPGIVLKEEKTVEPPEAVVIPDLSAAPSFSHSTSDICLALHEYNILDLKDCGIYLSAGTYNIMGLKAENITFHPYGPIIFNIKSTLDLHNCRINMSGTCRDFTIYADTGSHSDVYNTEGAFIVTGFTELVGKYNTIDGSITGNTVTLGVSTVRAPPPIQQAKPAAVYWREL